MTQKNKQRNTTKKKEYERNYDIDERTKENKYKRIRKNKWKTKRKKKKKEKVRKKEYRQIDKIK